MITLSDKFGSRRWKHWGGEMLKCEAGRVLWDKLDAELPMIFIDWDSKRSSSQVDPDSYEIGVDGKLLRVRIIISKKSGDIKNTMDPELHPLSLEIKTNLERRIFVLAHELGHVQDNVEHITDLQAWLTNRKIILEAIKDRGSKALKEPSIKATHTVLRSQMIKFEQAADEYAFEVLESYRLWVTQG